MYDINDLLWFAKYNLNELLGFDKPMVFPVTDQAKQNINFNSDQTSLTHWLSENIGNAIDFNFNTWQFKTTRPEMIWLKAENIMNGNTSITRQQAMLQAGTEDLFNNIAGGINPVNNTNKLRIKELENTFYRLNQLKQRATNKTAVKRYEKELQKISDLLFKLR